MKKIKQTSIEFIIFILFYFYYFLFIILDKKSIGDLMKINKFI